MSMDPMKPFLDSAVGYVSSMLREAYGIEDTFRIEPGGEIADFAFPCFQFSRRAGVSPQEMADRLAQGAEAAGGMLTVSARGGYLNMSASPHKLSVAAVGTVLQMQREYGRADRPPGERMLVEHTSINPTGPMHIGRTRNAVIGDTLVRSLRQAGVEVASEYYVNDVGKQVVVLYWGLTKFFDGEIGGKPDHELVRHYVRANELIEKDESAAAEVRDLQQKLESGDTALLAGTRKAAEMVLDGIKESLAHLNITHDRFVFESDLIKDGRVKGVIERLKKLPEASEDKGAWYLPFNGEEDRFYFTRSDGTSLYTTRDIAYHLDKLSRAGRLVDVLGEDQKLGMKFLVRTLELLGEAKRIDFLFHSFVSLAEGKMSTRHGVGVLVDDVISEAKSRAKVEVLKRRPDMNEGDASSIAGMVGVGAVRYNIARLQAEKKLVFKWEEALNFEGSSAPFIQYSHARACSILEKAGSWEKGEISYDEDNELRLARQLALFPSVLSDIVRTFAVHKVAAYAQQTAAEFNQFYRIVPVLRAPPGRLGSRLALVDASRIVLENALCCLGIDAPRTM